MTIPSSLENAPTVEAPVSGVSWAAIIAGAVAAIALSLVLLLLGLGFRLTISSPWSPAPNAKAIVAATAIWLIVTQWLSCALGGYLAGRLRTKWAGLHTEEIFFRDTAHGFLVWALATVVSASVLSSAVTAILGKVAPVADAGAVAGVEPSTALFTSLSLIVGAFVASAAAALGGRQRDEY